MEKDLKQKETSIIKITLYGPESTGKTTLSQQLAEHFNTVWIPEFARDYLQEKLDNEQKICDESDMLPIAIGQTKIENEALEVSNRFLFCDTNSMVTKVFSEIFYGYCDEELEEAVKNHHYDLFFLTNIDVPWEEDGLRDSPDNREQTFKTFQKALDDYKKPYILLTGNKEERFEKAIKIVEDLEKAIQNGLTSFDFVELYNQNKNLDVIINQFKFLKKGVSKIFIEKPATINNGVFLFSDAEFEDYNTIFNQKNTEFKVEKFVPASGAASRMFKFLSDFLSDFESEKESINAYINRKNDNALSSFLIGIEKFPFYTDVLDHLKEHHSDFETYSKDKKSYLFIKSVLTDSKYHFIDKPKGVLPFHKYGNAIVTPVEEHLKEVIEYATNENEANIHFTISEEHLGYFNEIINIVKPKLEEENQKKINISFSYQNPETDSITIDNDGTLLKDSNGNLVFRPGGHGALLHNLNERDSDIIFIKNIDNVSHNHLNTISYYKKGLGGLLIKIQKQIFNYLHLLDSETVSKEQITEISNFVKSALLTPISVDFEEFRKESKIKILKLILNRPIRVCGMVKNEKEPGGGPFWVKEENGSISLQIVESAQIDLTNTHQLKIFNDATHFNPVDIVCGIKNYKGEKFNLLQFTNPETGFIVEKSKNGINYKAYELPGLWNGSMSNWITLFIEVPLATFNPVKTVNDLLKPNHQPQ